MNFFCLFLRRSDVGCPSSDLADFSSSSVSTPCPVVFAPSLVTSILSFALSLLSSYSLFGLRTPVASVCFITSTPSFIPHSTCLSVSLFSKIASSIDTPSLFIRRLYPLGEISNPYFREFFCPASPGFEIAGSVSPSYFPDIISTLLKYNA